MGVLIGLIFFHLDNRLSGTQASQPAVMPACLPAFCLLDAPARQNRLGVFFFTCVVFSLMSITSIGAHHHPRLVTTTAAVTTATGHAQAN